LRKRLKKEEKEVGGGRENWNFIEIFQVIFDSIRYGSFSYVLVTSSHSSKPTGSVPEIQLPFTQFPI